VPGVWVRKAALREALDARAACSSSALARIGNRRLGPYEILQASTPAKYRSGNTVISDFLLLRAATGEAAADLPPPPDAAEMAAAAASSVESSDEEYEAPTSTPTMEQLALFPGVPLEITAALLALPPPGPGDATAAERQALLRGALSAEAPPPAVELPEAGDWVLSNNRSTAVKAARHAILLLRVRRVPPDAPPVAPAAGTSAL
jgi:hypothetical protein